jgi:pyruvate kinase
VVDAAACGPATVTWSAARGGPVLRRTKIVATIGPATREPKSLEALIEAGVDVLRLNFAHGAPSDHASTAALIRRLARAHDRVVGVLCDLPGPKMRTGVVEGDSVELHNGQRFTLVEDDVVGDATRASTTVDGLAGMVQPGDDVYLANGEIVLIVQEVQGDDVVCEVARGGVLQSKKGMHLPASERHVEAFTPEDEAAMQVALGFKADLVGLSFVRDADDIRRARAALPRRGPRPMLVAKIETRSAVANIEEIIEESDAVMVARGDLGIQMPLPQVPMIQKRIIRAANRLGKPCITATEMLLSMTRSPLPTRAEVADVANAVHDGTDALMLSEETAVGLYPIDTVLTMSAIAEAAEVAEFDHNLDTDHRERDDRVSWAVAHASVLAAEDLDVAAILCPTRSGATARRIAAFRPTMPIIGLSPRADTLGALAIVWGVRALLIPEVRERPEEVETAVIAARDAGLAKPDQLVAVVAGTPGPRAGGTDYVRIVRVWPPGEDWNRSHT